MVKRRRLARTTTNNGKSDKGDAVMEIDSSGDDGDREKHPVGGQPGGAPDDRAAGGPQQQLKAPKVFEPKPDAKAEARPRAKEHAATPPTISSAAPEA
eukprot:1774052-Pyramimonas_sp.AAC.1